MGEILLETATITAVEHKIWSGAVSSRIKVVAVLTAKVAAELEARWLLLDKRHAGFTTVDLDYQIKNVRVRFQAPQLDPLEFESELISHFRVFRKNDGQRKRLMVSFRITHGGSPFELLEYLIRVGGVEGRCGLVPLQKGLFEKEHGNGLHDDAESLRPVQ